MSKVSIIVPVYNGEKVVERCLNSILNQDYKDFEVIVVDDGSKDDSFKIISDIAAKDERVVAVHKENGGVSSTRNKALSLAEGDYIQFLDVDDWLPFDSTKLLVREMEEKNVDLVVGDFYRVVDDNVSLKGSIREAGVMTRNEYADKMMVTPADFYYGVLWNKLYRRSILEKYDIRMDNNISYCEDMIFNLEYLLHVDTVSIIKAPVYYYVKTEGSLVAQNLNIESTVKMKTSVIKYYNDFYKKILDEKDYEERRPIIYSYLIAFSTDAFSIPFVSSTRKLGQDKVYYEEQLKDSEFMYSYMSNAFFTRLLNTVAIQKKLEVNEVRIVYTLYKLNREVTTDELISYTGMSATSIAMAIAKLTALSYVKISIADIFVDNKFIYRYNSGSMDDLLDKIDHDFSSVSFEGVTEEEKKIYLKVKETMIDNIKNTIVNKED